MQIEFVSPLWIWQSETATAWHFVGLTEQARDEVRFIQGGMPRRGFGSVRVQVQVGSTVWRTSLFPDKARDTYLLPIKKAVREKEKLRLDQPIDVCLTLLEV